MPARQIGRRIAVLKAHSMSIVTLESQCQLIVQNDEAKLQSVLPCLFRGPGQQKSHQVTENCPTKGIDKNAAKQAARKSATSISGCLERLTSTTEIA